MKKYKYGKVNDVKLFAVEGNYGLSPVSSHGGLSMHDPDKLWEIHFDSGVYPGIKDVETYICGQVTRALNLDEF